MAAIKFTRWSKLVIRVFNGADPAVATPICTINAARGITFNANVAEDSIPDCADLEKLQWLLREKISLSADVSGSGKVNKPDVKTMFDWFKSPDPRRCQVVLDDADAANVITFEGDYHLNTFSLTGDPGTPTVTSDIGLQSSGEVEATYGANVGGA